MADLTWFNEARYGMFIHWGAYAVAARGEWAMNRERIPQAEYTERYVNNWKAERYDPDTWTALAKDAGMQYLVLTTRHHDGFALWDSAASDYNAAKLGPGRDLVRPFADAVRKAGLKVGFYYSPAAWTHHDYPGAFFRDWPGENDWRDEASRQRFIAYYRAQLRELLTQYGKVDILWFDGCIPENLDGQETLAMIREWQPDILINERLGPPYDIKNSEQAIKPAPPGQTWEACMTLNDNWGYHAGDTRWKNAGQVIDMLLTTAAGGGNLLLNVGPMPDGTIPEPSVRILREAGAWLARNREFLPHSERNPFPWNCCALVTVKGNRVYLHIRHDPQGVFCWADIKNPVKSAYFLASGAPIAFRQEGERLFLENLPSPLPDTPVTTVVLEVEGTPGPLTKQTTFWIPG